jgi:hypothetical protein
MGASAPHHYEYEFTTTRIVLLVVSIVLWLLFGVARTAREADEASFTVGYLLGTLGVALLVSWIVRSLYRLIRRRPVVSPAWTPGLFFGAAFVAFVNLVGASAPDS